MRRIPATMATQHPDSATTYVPVQKEAEESVKVLTPTRQGGFGIEEYMIDFEGKMTPYVQTSEVVVELISKGLVPGKDVFITPRIPSVSQETVFRQLMALMSIMEAYYRIHEETTEPSIVEVIHPMSKSAQELIDTRKRIVDVIDLTNHEFNISIDPQVIHVVPLIEEIPELITVKKLLTDYVGGCENLGLNENILRVMLGRSDAALGYGHLPSVLTNKLAISDCYVYGKDYDVTIAPIMGAGALPFRGHITLENVDSLLKDFRGLRTVTIQSSLIYDRDRKSTVKLIKRINDDLQKTKPLNYSAEQRAEILTLTGIFTKNYLKTFYLIIDLIKAISDFFPNQRDRLARKGSIGYARDVPRPAYLASCINDRKLSNELKRLQVTDTLTDLPRAIKYTGALYSIGLPPEFIATGRGLKEADERGLLDPLLTEYYSSLRADLNFAQQFINLKVAQTFMPYAAFKQVQQDVKFVYEYIALEEQQRNVLYWTLMETIKPTLKQLISTGEKILIDEVTQMGLIESCIVKMGAMRGALG
jgi:phosphoenolpyruvate carboxylase